MNNCSISIPVQKHVRLYKIISVIIILYAVLQDKPKVEVLMNNNGRYLWMSLWSIIAETKLDYNVLNFYDDHNYQK